MTTDIDGLIDRLAADLRPVRRLRPPLVRAAGWLVVVVLAGAALGTLAGIGPVVARLRLVPDERWAVGGAALTAILAAVAACLVSLPDRSGRWALLPVPGVAAWLSASGLGCLRGAVPGIGTPSMDESGRCFLFIVGLSVPLSGAMLLLLRRARPLRPGLTAVLGGLASAAAAAVLLTLFHPFQATWTDLLVHAFAVGLVVLANRALGRHTLA